MRSSLKWSLVATGIASLAALWLEPGDKGGTTTVVDARVPNPSGNAPAADPYGAWRAGAPRAMTDASAPPTALPSVLPERDMQAGQRDIFTPVTPPPPPPPPPPPAPPPPPPPPPPTPPPMNWRALGSMLTPTGERVVWLSKGSDEITVKPGMQLDDGYVVQSVDENQVVLLYPSIGTTARIQLPHDQSGTP
jgi:hypothetical protein